MLKKYIIFLMLLLNINIQCKTQEFDKYMLLCKLTNSEKKYLKQYSEDENFELNTLKNFYIKNRTTYLLIGNKGIEENIETTYGDFFELYLDNILTKNKIYKSNYFYDESINSFRLLDLNNDNVPELIIFLSNESETRVVVYNISINVKKLNMLFEMSNSYDSDEADMIFKGRPYLWFKDINGDGKMELVFDKKTPFYEYRNYEFVKKKIDNDIIYFIFKN